MKPYRILVTGWRDWPEADRSAVWSTLDWFTNRPGLAERSIIVVHGQCPYGGVDLWADQWAQAEPRAAAERHPVDFSQGKQAGPERNQRMVDLGADLCLAFPGPNSRGTTHCLNAAITAGIPTFTLPYLRVQRMREAST